MCQIKAVHCINRVVNFYNVLQITDGSLLAVMSALTNPSEPVASNFAIN